MLAEDELYVTVLGAKWPAFEAALNEIVAANDRMRRFYLDHQATVQAGAAPSRTEG